MWFLIVRQAGVCMARVVLAMSGGVDSSASALLLRREGHEVIGLFMRHGEQSAAVCATDGAKNTLLPIVQGRLDHKQGCCSASDADDARRVADRLDIPFYALDFQEEFGRIIDYFVEEYTSARTPNPCVMCNNWLKFGKLVDYADGIGADFIATGHYATLKHHVPGQPSLCRGVDPGKDQAYVLFGIDRKILPRLMFPVGTYQKAEIRDLAREAGLRIADKRDSQEICFVTSGDHADFVRRRRNHVDTSGELVLTDGTVVGKHEGLEQFTIGQRKGLGVAFGEPRYVVRLDSETRRVVIGTKEELGRTTLTADRANWLIDEPHEPFRAMAQIRYNGSPAPALVEPLDGSRLQVTFDEPRHGVAPGQAVVCFEDDQVLGGGWIE